MGKLRLLEGNRLIFVKVICWRFLSGPFAGGRHEFMLRDTRRLIIPNPHRGDIGPGLLSQLLRQANISRKEWERSK